MPASLYAGDYARVARKINNGFSPALENRIPRETKSYDFLPEPRA
jgi:hypothetical protein